MKKLYISLFICFSFFSFLDAQTVLINLGTTVVETSAIYNTGEPPWEIKYGPGDSLWMTTKNGKVYRIHSSSGEATLLLDYSANVYQAGEAGMLGMVFHPDFASNPYVYIAYTYTNAGNKERLSRFTYTGAALINEFVLIDNIVANTTHNGSRLVIMPDNTILMTTGDAANSATAQNMSSLNGKILRVNLDGTIPADNPVAGSRIYTSGHRNPQGLMLHNNGKVYSTEHGPGNNDEFQIIEKGRNYGWPNVEGFCDNDVAGESAFCTANNVKEPLASWNPVPGGTWAPADLVWYSHPSIPEFENSFLVVFLKTQKVRRVRMNAAGDAITSQTDFFVNQWGRLRDITTGPDGSIYIVTNVNPYRIIKIKKTTVTPVVLSRYEATCNQNTATISWSTETEINNKQFLVYKSNDGLHFNLAASISSSSAAGINQGVVPYSFTDNERASTQVFYKLVSEDKDGRKKEWGIVTPSCGITRGKFLLLPNPAKDQSILSINGLTALVNIQVHNSLGQSIYKNRANGTVSFPVKNWAPGIYHVTVTGSRNEILYKNKLVVQ